MIGHVSAVTLVEIKLILGNTSMMKENEFSRIDDNLRDGIKIIMDNHVYRI